MKNLPSSDSNQGSDEAAQAANGFLRKYHDKLAAINLVELDNEDKITPQVIAMTSSVESLLSEFALVFSQLIDEIVADKYEILEKDQKLIQVAQQRAMVSSK